VEARFTEAIPEKSCGSTTSKNRSRVFHFLSWLATSGMNTVLLGGDLLVAVEWASYGNFTTYSRNPNIAIRPSSRTFSTSYILLSALPVSVYLVEWHYNLWQSRGSHDSITQSWGVHIGFHWYSILPGINSVFWFLLGLCKERFERAQRPGACGDFCLLEKREEKGRVVFFGSVWDAMPRANECDWCCVNDRWLRMSPLKLSSLKSTKTQSTL